MSLKTSKVLKILIACTDLLLESHCPVDDEVEGIVCESRKAKSASLFIAYRGEKTDAHDFIQEVYNQGCRHFVCETKTEYLQLKNKNMCVFMVSSGRQAWTLLTAAFFKFPQEKLNFIGITGTNGKTSTTLMLSEMLFLSGIANVSIGTLGANFYYDGKKDFLPLTHTTPDPEVFFNILDLAVQRKITWVVMEVSSHGLVQKKLGDLQFKGLGFTSFSQDHLDFHKSISEYWNTKMSFFNSFAKRDAVIVVNEKLKDVFLKSYSGNIKVIDTSLAEFQEINFPFVADFLKENFLVAKKLFEEIFRKKFTQSALLSQIPGRCERVSQIGQPTVIVDYAHTPDALENILKTVKPKDGRLIVVFGCGGDRDKSKRPLMGAVAARLADLIILTSDNPRTEDPEQILAEILQGIKVTEYIKVISDRRLAIKEGIQKSHVKDCVVIAGKGHEDHQIIGREKLPFDDRKVAREFLQEKFSDLNEFV